MRGLLAWGVIVVAAGCGSFESVVEPTVPDAMATPEPTPVVIDQQSVVRVSGEACGSLSTGGGVAVAEDLVVTNAHVVAGVADVVVEVAGASGPLDGTVVGFDAGRDLAAVRVPGAGLTPVVVHDGTPTTALRLVTVDDGGRVEERAAGPTRRIVATGDDIYRNPGARRDAIELSVAVVQGESGSGFFGADGALVGVLFASSSRDDLRSYAVAASEVTAFLADLGDGVETAGPCLSQPPPEPDGG